LVFAAPAGATPALPTLTAPSWLEHPAITAARIAAAPEVIMISRFITELLFWIADAMPNHHAALRFMDS
jgi:hypothetical protein